MNPLELQVLSIVCGVAGNTPVPPSTDPLAARQPLVVLPPASTPPIQAQRVPVSR
jgi:hypothetical protein